MSTYVYAIAAGPYVKFGITADPYRRINDIRRNGNAKKKVLTPPGLDTSSAGMIVAFPGGREMEWRIHNHFGPERVAGEWFSAPRGGRVREFLKFLDPAQLIDRRLDDAAAGYCIFSRTPYTNGFWHEAA